jgi:5-methylcytosine-specific restriction endonuclease McrA
MKRSPLQRKTPLLRSNDPQRRLDGNDPPMPLAKARQRSPKTHRAARKQSQGKMSTHVVQAVKRRSRGRCERCGTAPATQLHHRRLRSQGGRNTLENLVDLCAPCHNASADAIHANVDWAHRHGWIVPSWQDPADVEPVVGCLLDCAVDHFAELS